MRCMPSEVHTEERHCTGSQNLSTATTMNSAVTAFLACLLVLCAQGQLDNGFSNCKCSKSYVGRINSQLIQSGPVVHNPSVFCPHIEIIITLKGNKERCVDPQSPLGKLILKNKHKHDKKTAVTVTAASGQTNTQSSPSAHTSSRL
ncbi:C-X-C motif chemokine 10-like [Toxotes jaculatrix]|uniref:C-X-C motif chemokine 10-like n=1 Tax=Toxotes jaculatrix TaxID=941984 RepID=UPI001B3ABC50|nr:C-X-C motif chemokine 10-like [Toxotes jaculatrix]